MKISMLAHIIDEDLVTEPGQVIDVPDEKAKDLIEKQLAVRFEDPKKEQEKKPAGPVERAVAGKRETTEGAGNR